MEYRPLGATGIEVPLLSFGAGPVSSLLTGEDRTRQLATVEQALALGIDWFDTAATYGEGQSERSLGQVLADLGAAERVGIATKVRFQNDDLADISAAVRRSVHSSLQRLRVPRVALLQLHNSITTGLGDLATSITPAHVLAPGGVLEAMHKLRDEGLVAQLGLTGFGHPAALKEVINSGEFATVQTPVHLLNPSAVLKVSADFAVDDYGNIAADCAQNRMGVFAIRVLAAGALALQPPSAHTLKTKFFPLDLYQRDQARAARLKEVLPPGMTLQEAAIRFVTGHPRVTSAIIGFGAPEHVLEAVRFAAAGPLPEALVSQLQQAAGMG